MADGCVVDGTVSDAVVYTYTSTEFTELIRTIML